MATTMASPAQIKSILKKYPSQPTSTELTNLPSTPSAPSYSRPDPKTFEDRNREIALYHANLLQQRKDIELTILLATETLIDFPLSPPPQYTSSSPSPSDASQFKTLLQHFTTSDYDALIEERNINEKCGYALCPKRRVKEGGGGEWRLLGMGGKARDFRVVRKQELEMWCQQGNQCKRRALYVRVQLGDTPAWERGAGGLLGSRIDLLDEPKTDQDTVMEGILSLKLDGERKEMDGRNLALERGERGMSARSGIVDVKILERDVVRKVEPPSLGEEELRAKLEHLELEGYTSKFGEQRKKLLEMERNGDEMDEDGDEEDTDWKL
ncbi:uncharacterized protein RSE6_02196 [Rhynchosporium secalis]|uniref:RNA polymerase II subunit B1 CTD phosphatase RPAP2 homolog n=1 Tax=Rhynchosporium secalis TaxID=38038 RepID=A0A1E1LZP6_RHYSE|nr:uncharacterized protein RSE6_02196 [Rhynchosporium secalis]